MGNKWILTLKFPLDSRVQFHNFCNCLSASDSSTRTETSRPKSPSWLFCLSTEILLAYSKLTDQPKTVAHFSIYAMRWDASFAIIRSLAFVLACDFTPMMPPPHCLRNSSNRSLKLACTQSQPRTCGYPNSGNPPKGKWTVRCVAGWRQHTV